MAEVNNYKNCTDTAFGIPQNSPVIGVVPVINNSGWEIPEIWLAKDGDIITLLFHNNTQSSIVFQISSGITDHHC